MTRVSSFDLPDKREGNVRSFEPTNGVETIVAYDADERTNEPTTEPSTGTDAGDDSIPSLLAPVPVPVPKAAARVVVVAVVVVVVVVVVVDGLDSSGCTPRLKPSRRRISRFMTQEKSETV